MLQVNIAIDLSLNKIIIGQAQNDMDRLLIFDFQLFQ